MLSVEAFLRALNFMIEESAVLHAPEFVEYKFLNLQSDIYKLQLLLTLAGSSTG